MAPPRGLAATGAQRYRERPLPCGTRRSGNHRKGLRAPSGSRRGPPRSEDVLCRTLRALNPYKICPVLPPNLFCPLFPPLARAAASPPRHPLGRFEPQAYLGEGSSRGGCRPAPRGGLGSFSRFQGIFGGQLPCQLLWGGRGGLREAARRESEPGRMWGGHREGLGEASEGLKWGWET